MSVGEFLKRIGVYVKVVGKRALGLVHRAHRRFCTFINSSGNGRITYQQFIHPEDSKKMIDRETVKNVAKLARLGLTEEEINTLGNQLSVILENIAILQQADVSGVSPTSHASRLINIMREDIPRPSYPPELLLANAPDQEDNYLKIPAVLEGES